jgi:hypothetical protein
LQLRLPPPAPIRRRKLRRLYGPVIAERVLAFCLKNYPHGTIDGLRQAAGIAA